MSKATVGCTAAEVLAKRRASSQQFHEQLAKRRANAEELLGFTESELNEVLFTYGSDVHDVIEDDVAEFIVEMFTDLTSGYSNVTEWALSFQGLVNRARKQR